MPNNLFIISGPSGVGEDSIIEGLKPYFSIEKIITSTTRPSRSGEVHGQDYYFLDKQTFLDKIERQEFAEYALQYNDHYYGVDKQELERVRNLDKIGIWKIEYKGVQKAKELFPDIKAILISASLDTIENRIRKTRNLSEQEIQERMEYSKNWLHHTDIYDYVVYNEDGHLQDSINKTVEIIKSHSKLDKV